MWLVHIPLYQWIMSSCSSLCPWWFSKLLLASLTLCSPGGHSLPPLDPAVDPSKEDLKCMRDSSHFLHLFSIGAWSFASQVYGCLSPLGATCPRSGTSLCHVSGALPVLSQRSLWAIDWCWFHSRHLSCHTGHIFKQYSTMIKRIPIYSTLIHSLMLSAMPCIMFLLGIAAMMLSTPRPLRAELFTSTSSFQCCTLVKDILISFLQRDSLQEANALGNLVLTLFSIIDIGKVLGQRDINTSELGSRLLEWCAIPRHTFIMDVWTAHPARVTYEWLKSLRMLLHIFQHWTMYERMHSNHGCEEFSSGDQTMVSVCMNVAMLGLIRGQLSSLITELENWDQALKCQWLQQSGDVDDAQWLHPAPSDHLLQPVAKRPCSNSDKPGNGSRSGSLKRSKKHDIETDKPAASAKEKPFVSSGPLFLLKQPMEKQSAYIDICQRIGNPYFPRWEENGKNHYVCILSCLSLPLHTCDMTACKKRWCKKMVHHHIHPTKHQWKSKLEAFCRMAMGWTSREAFPAEWRI